MFKISGRSFPERAQKLQAFIPNTKGAGEFRGKKLATLTKNMQKAEKCLAKDAKAAKGKGKLPFKPAHQLKSERLMSSFVFFAAFAPFARLNRAQLGNCLAL